MKVVWDKIEEHTGRPIDPKSVADLVEQQIKLKGTFTLHSETTARNGGDLDLFAVVDGDEEHFPRFYNCRFELPGAPSHPEEQAGQAPQSVAQLGARWQRGEGKQDRLDLQPDDFLLTCRKNRGGLPNWSTSFRTGSTA